jgi:hypothetical protein
MGLKGRVGDGEKRSIERRKGMEDEKEKKRK